MFFYFLYPLSIHYSILNVFKYITFRTFGATITSVLLAMVIGPFFIRWLKGRKMEQVVRSDGPRSHFSKRGTPTMGGGVILFSVLSSVVLWSDWTNPYVWFCVFTVLSFGFLGFIDDYLKIKKKNPNGLTMRQKLFFQVLFAGILAVLLYFFRETPPVLKVPFFKYWGIFLGWGFIPFEMLVIVGASNAVNLTDGLDGLAVGPVMTTAATFLILSYCAGHLKMASYLQISYVPGAGELAVFLGAVLGGCLGFLWFNTYPAQVFMGDVGALALGAILGLCAIISKNELLLVLCGGIFVLEAISVMVQIVSFRLTGKRVFRMAPIHHHFELKGWPEPKIIVRFWIISILLALISLATLKLR